MLLVLQARPSRIFSGRIGGTISFQYSSSIINLTFTSKNKQHYYPVSVFKVRDTDEEGEPVPFTVDDLASSVYADMPLELQPLSSFSGFVKGVRKPQKRESLNSAPLPDTTPAPLPVITPPGTTLYTFIFKLHGHIKNILKKDHMCPSQMHYQQILLPLTVLLNLHLPLSLFLRLKFLRLLHSPKSPVLSFALKNKLPLPTNLKLFKVTIFFFTTFGVSIDSQNFMVLP